MKRREFFTVQSRETLENALEPHADLRAAPQSIYRGKRRIDIIEIIDQWYGPGYRYVKVRGRHAIWQVISGGKECVSCQTTKNNWFTAVHHRETPDRIKTGQSDAGVVWRTEVLQARRDGADVDAVTLPDEDSLRAEVAYVIGAMNGSPHRVEADAFLAFLQSPRGQDAYAKF